MIKLKVRNVREKKTCFKNYVKLSHLKKWGIFSAIKMVNLPKIK